ncbi:MAG: hypothetical protein ABI883_09135 [Chthoniobacterales bacterium]
MKTIIATYATASNADTALGALHALGLTNEQISVMTLDSKALGEVPGSHAVGKASDDAAQGALQGAKLGLVGGLLVGVAALTIPGLGPLLAVGPLASALGISGVVGTAVTGAGIGAAVGGIGAMVGSFVKMGVSETEAKALEGDLRTGAVVISVQETGGLDVAGALNAGMPTRVSLVG